MAPNHGEVVGYPFSDNYRCSPRIFNKNLLKFDVSTANDKIGFMRSLNLLCVNNSKEFQSRVNWDILTPGVHPNVPLKECSVVLKGVNWNTTGNLIHNQTNVMHSENVHCKTNMKKRNVNLNTTGSLIDNQTNVMDPENVHCKTNIKKRGVNLNTAGSLIDNQTNVIDPENVHCKTNMNKRESKNVSRSERDEVMSCALFVNTSSSESVDKTEVVKSKSRKRKSSSATKLTFKIGDEVISKKYCKKKYLDKENPDDQMSSTVDQHDDCEKRDDVESSMGNCKAKLNVANTDQVCIKEPNAESHVQNKPNEKWLIAAALVELELERQRERSANSQVSKSKTQDHDAVQKIYNNNNINKKHVDDSVVPKENEVMPLSSLVDDDVQKVLRVTKNPKELCTKSNNTLQQDRLGTVKDCEIITIDDDDDDDDDVCDDSSDDCVILDEPSSHDSKDKENSYDFNLTVTSKLISMTDRNRRNYCSDSGRPIKRQRLHNLDLQVVNR